MAQVSIGTTKDGVRRGSSEVRNVWLITTTVWVPEAKPNGLSDGYYSVCCREVPR